MQNMLFDTYAIMEIIGGNENYQKFLDYTPIINDFVLAELTYSLIVKHGEKKAFEYADKYSGFSEKPDYTIIKDAAAFRYKNRKKKMSMPDCIGYFHAKALGIKFLTGDVQFKNLPNAEFVK